MADKATKLLFLELRSGAPVNELCWISRFGDTAALVVETLTKGVAQQVVDLLGEQTEQQPANVEALAASLDQAFGDELGKLGVVLLSSTGPAEVRALARGKVQLIELSGQQRTVRDLIQQGASGWRAFELSVAPQHQRRYLISGGALDLGKLRTNLSAVLDASTRTAWNSLGEKVLRNARGTCLVFPALSGITYRSAGWPYDPFVGAQEDADHERRGLADVVTGLFRDPTFHGFRVLPTPIFFTDNSSRLYDGVLVSPWGVFLLELKHWRGRVHLHEHREFNGVEQFPEWPKRNGHRLDTNPVKKMAAKLRTLKSHESLRAIGGLHGGWLTRIGAVVFTHPEVDVRMVRDDGQLALPRFGEVVVAKPGDLAQKLRAKFEPNSGRKWTTPPLDCAAIDRIVDLAMGRATTQAPATAVRTVGWYEFANRPIEKTPYASLFEGKATATGKKVWLRRIDALSVVKAGKERAAVLSGLRENVALQQLLPQDERLQRVLDKVEEGHELFVVLEPVEHPPLEKWLESRPPRVERVALLRRLGELLVLLEQHRVIHRALNASSVRVRPDGVPVLTNFELCHLESVATISAEARSALDRGYSAPEVDRPGAQLTAAADAYSLGRLVCRVLSGALPFETHVQQAVWLRRPDAYAKLAKSCELTQPQQVAKLLAPSPAQRAKASELVAWTSEW